MSSRKKWWSGNSQFKETMRLAWFFFFIRFLAAAEYTTVANFLEYKNLSVEDTGWLTLKQDERNPLYLPMQYTVLLLLLLLTSVRSDRISPEYRNSENPNFHAK